MDLLVKYKDCVDTEIYRTKQPIVVLKERQRRYELINEDKWEVTKFVVEGCITKGWGEKGCEAILFADHASNEMKAFFVELKGMSVRQALKQIKSSLEKTKNDLKGARLYGRIIPSEYKTTKFLESERKALHLQFKNFGGDLIIKENHSDTL